jgi:ligand-binding sensor domain-containing protein/serine phosphatase RsbU (regulator of sigma subunit)
MLLSVKIRIKENIICKAILLPLFLLMGINTFSQDYNFHNFTSEDGLPQSYVYSIIQDVHGYLWVGTGNGLCRYNGFVFETYPTGDSLANSYITCSISDDEGLWFGHSNGGLSYFNGKKYNVVSIHPPNQSPITHFAKSSHGRIWASTYSGELLKLSRDTGTIGHYLFKAQTIITSFEFLNDRELLVGTNTGLILCRLGESEELEIIRRISEIPESKITCIQKMPNKPLLYIATENDGIFEINNEDNLVKVLKINAYPDSDFTDIQYIYKDSQSNLWLGSFGKGLIKMAYSASGEVKKIYYFSKASGFPTDDVKTIYEDREGNIWSGNFGQGLTLITPKTFSLYSFDNPLYGKNILSFCFDQKYKWIGTETGLVKMDQNTNKVIRFYGQGTGLPKDKVTTIYSNDGKELWIGTGENGVFRMEITNNKILKYPIENGDLENSITIITGKGDEVWIGTRKGLWNVNPNKKRKKLYSLSHGGLPHNYINSLFFDRKGKLWVSTPGSILTYIQDENIIKLPINSRSGNLTLGPVTEDPDLRIWVGSIGNGIFMIQSDSIANLTVKEGLLSNFCYSVICDDNKNIWVGHKGGLSRIRTTDFSVKPIQHIEGITESLIFNPNAITKDQTGKIWFGSDKGMILYDPTMEYPHIQPPVLGITSIKINNDEMDISDKIILSPGNYKIRFDFLGVSLKEPQLVNYQYKLEGFDQWSEITKNTSITYNNITEGNYTFILKASNGDGAVTLNPLTISIIIKEPIWKEWWFFPLIVLLLITLIFIYIKRREYKFISEKRILEEKVVERTIEIQNQKNEIELQRDIINEKNANITSSIKYASHIQNAILPPLELIDKLLPDSFILSKPKDIVSGDFYWITEKDNKIVFTVADSTGHGVPGAFMSLLGITYLNEIVNIEGITKSVDIVNKLRERVILALQQGRKDIPTTDGMDIALCVLDKNMKKIQYTGGMINLVYVHDGKLEVIRSDRTSVCFLYDFSSPFTMKEFEYKTGDVLYLFSDGYPDQFGGEHDRKYFVHRLYVELLDIHRLPMLKQKQILEKNLKEWMRGNIQTDDITVLGIRL